jgi:glycosyltransferase involved in cell wall biosynthesis
VTPPTISVIIPTRNRPDYLRAAVASVRAQRHPPAEILVVDDGVGAGEVLRAMPEVRVLPGRGAGPGAARNVGLQAAQGELIAFLDDDDLWRPEKLAWQVEWMARRADLAALGTGALRLRHPALEQVAPCKPARLRPIGRAALVRANRLTTSSVLARRDSLMACGGFDESLSLAQDWDLWLRLSSRWPLAVLPAPLTVHRLHDEQRSARRAEMRRHEAQVVARVLKHDPGWWLRGVAQRRLAWAQCRLGRALLCSGEPHRATEALQESLSLYPLLLPAWSALARCVLSQLILAGASKL